MEFGFPDWRTTQQHVVLLYKDDEAERFYPRIRCPEDAEKKTFTTEEEYDLMEKQVEESKGFDIDFSMFRCVFNYQPVSFERQHDFGPDETNTELMDRLSREALDGFNEKHNTKYDFVKVVKANFHSLMGILFYITFKGKLHSESDDDSEVFQAKVWCRYSGSEVISCELKPKEKKVHSSSEALEKDDPKKPRLTT